MCLYMTSKRVRCYTVDKGYALGVEIIVCMKVPFSKNEMHAKTNNADRKDKFQIDHDYFQFELEPV